MEDSSSHGCHCCQCPPWWVTMGFIPPLQNKSVNVETSQPNVPPTGVQPGSPGTPGTFVTPGTTGTPAITTPTPRVPNAVNPILDLLNPLGPLNPLGGLIKGLFG